MMLELGRWDLLFVGGGMLVCGLGMLLTGVVIVWVYFRMARRATQAANLTPDQWGITASVVEDGFWLEGPAVIQGTVVRYRCRVDGQERTETLTLEPGPRGHFVHTGGRPTEIELLEVRPESRRQE